jgi:hypothetical protein
MLIMQVTFTYIVGKKGVPQKEVVEKDEDKQEKKQKNGTQPKK